MKINVFPGIVSATIAALIAFGFYTANDGDTNRILFTAGAWVSLFATLGGTIAVSSPNGGTMNLRVVSGIFFFVLLIAHIVFSIAGIGFSPYVIITGILLLLYSVICYAVMRALK